MTTTSNLISARGFSKTFGGRRVLQAVDLDVGRGEVHGLVGQNGSGKSTFIKILAGFHAPDHGARLDVGGAAVGLPLAPNQPAAHGMFFVHQDLGLAETMTVVENLRAGSYDTAFGWRIQWKKERAAAARLLEEFRVSASPDSLIGDLRGVDRAMVAILRALTAIEGKKEGFLVLDEASSYLPRDGVEVLFDAIRKLANRGIGVLFVSHRLDEVRAVTDRVSVLRDGQLVATGATDTFSERDMIAAILGRSLGDLYPEANDPLGGEVLLSLRNVTGRYLRDFSLDLKGGEVVGLTGLLGMGAEEVLYIVFGAEKATGGEVLLHGRVRTAASMTPRVAIQNGMVFLPGDRHRHGGTRVATLRENVTLPALQPHFRTGILRLNEEAAHVRELLHAFHVEPPQPDQAFGTLSGGNQQKALLAKWFNMQPSILLLHEPTQGVDIGAKSQIFRLIGNARQSGQAILIASAEYEDLAHICDRVIVFRDGSAVTELSGAALSPDRIIEQSFISDRRQAAPMS